MMSTDRHFHYVITDWCNRLFGAKLDTEGLCSLAKATGTDLDLVGYDQWGAVHANGVKMGCVMPDMSIDSDEMAPFVPGFNDPAHHDRVHNAIDAALDKASAAGVPFVIAFTGMDNGDDRNVQFQRIVDGFTKPHGDSQESLVKKAERLGITIVIEMLNVKGDEETWRGHPGYLGTSTDELVEKVIKPIGSKHLRLLFDLYHVTMMGEDVIEMIERHHEFIGYVHVAGVMLQDKGHHPRNRGELTIDGQVIDFPAAMSLLATHLPKGTYVLLEYIPDPTDPQRVQQDLLEAIKLCESKVD